MAGHPIEVLPVSRHRWVVRFAGDPTPLAEHATRADAEAEARNVARRFGERVIHVQELDGERHDIHVPPNDRAPPAAHVPRPRPHP
jgi:2-polyprenyl-6-methoxyphenol hydroxylase-like FAD-dependent oxidoreductase